MQAAEVTGPTVNLDLSWPWDLCPQMGCPEPGLLGKEGLRHRVVLQRFPYDGERPAWSLTLGILALEAEPRDGPAALQCRPCPASASLEAGGGICRGLSLQDPLLGAESIDSKASPG